MSAVASGWVSGVHIRRSPDCVLSPGICRLSPLPVGPAYLCLAPEIDVHFKEKRVLSEQSSYAGFKFFILSILKFVFNEYVLHL